MSLTICLSLFPGPKASTITGLPFPFPVAYMPPTGGSSLPTNVASKVQKLVISIDILFQKSMRVREAGVQEGEWVLELCWSIGVSAGIYIAACGSLVIASGLSAVQ